MRQITRKRKFVGAVLCLSLISVFNFQACNIFGFIDDPSGDEQILSAARACFDEGDLDCAIEFYNELSDDFKDIRNMELAFAILDQNGITMGTFIEAFGDGSGGKGLGTLARKLSGDSATEDRRKKVHEAFSKADLIENRTLQGFVQFVTALTFASHILAEGHNSDGVPGFTGDDFVASSSTCKEQSDVAAGCASSSCTSAGALADAVPDGNTPPLSSSSTVTGTMDLEDLHGAIKTVLEGMNKIGIGGKFEKVGDFLNTINALSGVASAPCYRYLLISEGIAD